MTIVISQQAELIAVDQEIFVSNKYEVSWAGNKATKIAILKDITIDSSTLSASYGASRVSTTSAKVPVIINTGHSGVKLTFSTYIRPFTDSGINTSQEKVLWDSLAGVSTVDTATESTVAFSNNSNLPTLYFYIVLEDGTFYRISEGIVSSVNIDLKINTLAKATWEVHALEVSYIPDNTKINYVAALREAPTTFIKNKLSTINIDSTYVLAVIDASLTITNNMYAKSRTRVGEITSITGYYSGDREVKLDLSFYLNTNSFGSYALQNYLSTRSTLAILNSTHNIVFSIGGNTSTNRVDINIPYGKIQLKTPKVGLQNTVVIQAIPQESTRGAADDISLVYYN